VRVLTWNLYHGRAVPPAGRSLEGEFRAALEGWEWDIALLQEVPPWWPPRWPWPHDTVLTSRNLGLPVRRALARRWPDLLKSNGGGANAILVRDGTPIAARRRVRLRWLPERRWAHGVLLGATWVVNLHGQAHREAWARRDLAPAVGAWADAEALVLGGDLNLRRVEPQGGLAHAGGHSVDHVLARGLAPRESTLLDRGSLSDHVPVLIELARNHVRP